MFRDLKEHLLTAESMLCRSISYKCHKKAVFVKTIELGQAWVCGGGGGGGMFYTCLKVIDIYIFFFVH